MSASRRNRSRSTASNEDQTADSNYDVPEFYINLNELAAPSPIKNPSELPINRSYSLEDARRSRDEAKIGRASSGHESARKRRFLRADSHPEDNYEMLDSYAHLGE